MLTQTANLLLFLHDSAQPRFQIWRQNQLPQSNRGLNHFQQAREFPLRTEKWNGIDSLCA